jgi:peptide/nickel transport system ATP-binding protein
MTETDLIEISELNVVAHGQRGEDVSILRDINLTVPVGARLGIIGQSGSGKTTLVRVLAALEAPGIRIASGTISYDGRVVFGEGIDRRRDLRGSSIGTVFQSATRSTNPYRRLGSQLDEVAAHHLPTRTMRERQTQVADLLAQMGLEEPDRMLRSYPHQVSGGQLQRVSIAMALLSDPRLLVADECTSALDVGTQADVVGLLRRAVTPDQSMLFVTHDLGLAARVCDQIAVMFNGRIVDQGPAAELLKRTGSPYTKALLEASPPWAPADGSWPPPIQDFAVLGS